jgi:cytolysin-activating lysine-acyltransferase
VTAPDPAGNAQETPQLSEAELQKRALASKLISAAYGDIVSLLTRSPFHQKLTLRDLDWMAAAPVVTRQFAMAEKRWRHNGAVTPVGVVTWATVSPEVDARLSASTEDFLRLKPAEWKSGDIPWIIAVVGDTKATNGILRQLSDTVFKDKPAKVRARSKDGQYAVGYLKLVAEQQPAATT